MNVKKGLEGSITLSWVKDISDKQLLGCSTHLFMFLFPLPAKAEKFDSLRRNFLCKDGKTPNFLI